MTAALHAHPALVSARAWLAGSVGALAVAAADEAFADLRGLAARGGSPGGLLRHAEERGLVPLLAWADAMALAGLDREPWAREAALGAVRAYAGRLGELMADVGEGGRL